LQPRQATVIGASAGPNQNPNAEDRGYWRSAAPYDLLGLGLGSVLKKECILLCVIPVPFS
jgi:hypothetical protein